jgi:hypothetical protein
MSAAVNSMRAYITCCILTEWYQKATTTDRRPANQRETQSQTSATDNPSTSEHSSSARARPTATTAATAATSFQAGPF